MPVVDGSQIKDLQPVAVGWYDATFDKYELKLSEKNNQYDACEFVSEIDGEERRFFYNLTLTEKSLWKYKQVALALGADQAIFEGEFDTEDVLDELLGAPCRLKIGVQKSGQYAGRNQVEDVRGPQLDMDEAANDDLNN